MKSTTLSFNPKQQSFLTLLAQGVSEPDAASQCWGGEYARKKLYRRGEKMQLAIVNVKDGLSTALGVTREDIIEGFLDAANMARNKEDAMAMIAAWRELGKLTGHYEPQVTRVEHQLVESGEFDKLPDHKLLELAGDQDPITLSESEYEVIDVEIPDDKS